MNPCWLLLSGNVVELATFDFYSGKHRATIPGTAAGEYWATVTSGALRRQRKDAQQNFEVYQTVSTRLHIMPMAEESAEMMALCA